METMRAYVDALKREIRNFPLELAGLNQTADYSVRSVFFGGGTPSILPADWIGEILDDLKEKFLGHLVVSTANEKVTFACVPCEISIECNPGTADMEKLVRYRNMGINRISFGLQSADDRELQTLGRIHSWKTFLDIWEACEKAGFINRNIDLMCALPGQTESSWEGTLHKVLALHPEHLSVYSLIIEEGTPFFDRYAKDAEIRDEGGIPRFLPSEEAERAMVHRAKELLERSGYRQYEISNYSLPGRECLHNIGYWQGTEYLGFGLGAASCMCVEPGVVSCICKEPGAVFRQGIELDADLGQQAVLRTDTGGESGLCTNLHTNSGHKAVLHTDPGRGSSLARWKNAENLTDYIRKDAVIPSFEVLSEEDQMEEFMFLGLRMTDGIRKTDFQERFGIPVEEIYGEILQRHKRNGLLEENGSNEKSRIRLTGRGMDVANYVMSDFLL